MSIQIFLTVLFSSAIPITELQGAIPFFLFTHPDLPTWFVVLAAVLGAMIPPLILLRLLPFLNNWLHNHLSLKPHSHFRFVKRFLDWFYQKAHQKHGKTFERFGELALVVITGVPFPIPGSGVWTGSALAFLLNIPRKKAVLMIFIGVLISASIVTAASTGAINLADYF